MNKPCQKQTVKLVREGAIARVQMEDRESKNTFSEALMAGLLRVFDEIRGDSGIKAVVLHGYDNYFCCGGTRQELLKIHRGEAVFTDLRIHDILLNCEVPVISAMQGHALGGGLVLGAYADVIVMSNQCFYSANFMNYGFTPGFGSTFILLERFGSLLGREMLFGANNYSGAELRQRGIGALVVDKKEVVNRALLLASELSSKSRLSLVLLKQHFRERIRSQLDRVIERELEMHAVTFSQPEVLARIDAEFSSVG